MSSFYWIFTCVCCIWSVAVNCSQAYCNIVAGACLAIGLKYAGSANAAAFTCLVSSVA